MKWHQLNKVRMEVTDLENETDENGAEFCSKEEGEA